MAGKNSNHVVRCSFCGKPEGQIRKMIAGPEGVFICNECIDLCNEILGEELDDIETKETIGDINLLKPKEIKE